MDAERFEELLEACRRSLERYVFYRISDREDAEDLLAAIHLKAFEKRDSLLNPESSKAWILRIASNRCNDYFRDQANSMEIEWEDELDEILTMNRAGRTMQRKVRDTLDGALAAFTVGAGPAVPDDRAAVAGRTDVRPALAEVGRVPDDDGAGSASPGGRVVARAVVDADDMRESAAGLRNDLGDDRRLVEQGHDEPRGVGDTRR